MHGPADSPFPLKGKVFLCLHKIPSWDITLNRTRMKGHPALPLTDSSSAIA